MAFASPLWLLALVPWALLAAWLLRGRRRRVKVPFLDLWRGPLPLEIPRRGWRTPPLWLVLALASLLATILAAGKPIIRTTRLGGAPLTIIIDRGISMSAREHGTLRYVAVSDRVDQQMRQTTMPDQIRLVIVPGEAIRGSGSHWIDTVRNLAPTALDTHEALRANVLEELARSDRPVLLISDQASAIPNPRLVQIGPTREIENVAIVKLAARATPTPQVMVRVRNDSPVPPVSSPAEIRDRRTAGADTGGTRHLRVSSDQRTSERAIELPPAGQERNYFFDLPQLGNVLKAELLDPDDQPADDVAWLVREKSFPRIEMRAALSPEVRRIVEVYQRNRPPGPGSKLVAITSAAERLTSDSPGVVVSSVDGLQTVTGTVNVAAHPVTREVNWQSIVAQARASVAAPAGFQPVVSAGNHVLVAVRDGPARQVWVGFDAPNWSASVDFVVFWANVLSWVGQGEESFASHPLSDFQSDWKPVEMPKVTPIPAAGQWPGIYEAPDGSKFALNAPLVRYGVSPDVAQMQKLTEMLESRPNKGRSMTSWLLLIGIGLIGAACWMWRSDFVRRSNGLSGVI